MCLAKIFSLLKGKPLPTLPTLPTPPVVPAWMPATEYQFTDDQVFVVTDQLAKEHIYLWDDTYWILSLDDWKKIFDNVLKNMPVYKAQRFDCDKFAMLCAARIYERYELNSCAVVEGKSPISEHAFNLFISWETDKMVPHILEPQTGMIDPPGYEINTIIFG